METKIDRRSLLKTGAFGLGAISSVGAVHAVTARGFSHSVASGEPSQNSILLWTRFVSANDETLTAEISETADFSKIKSGKQGKALRSRDYIAKITVDGLEPGRWYYYRFVAANGKISDVGRTRTLPEGRAQKFNLGVFSCANLLFGHFNAYAHACERQDLDLIVHLGDYIYEYHIGKYPKTKYALAGRVIAPSNEILELSDYRLRYASYRADPDLRRLHQLYPMIVQWDDHEFANDAARDGAENHDPKTEGDWETRKKIAERVYREWMPVADDVGEERWSDYQIGDLATIFKTESRIGGRDTQLDLAPIFAAGGDIGAALVKFRDGAWQDPARSMLGKTQQKWLADGIRASKSKGTKWQVLAQQCVMGELQLPLGAEKWVPKKAPKEVRQGTAAAVAASKAGLPFNLDAWDGYPQARANILNAAQQADADLIVLGGDSHNGWALNLENDGQKAGVEFAGHSVTSPGFESFVLGATPNVVAKALVERNDQLVWANTHNRGYMTVALSEEQVETTYHNLKTVRAKSTELVSNDKHVVEHGAKVIS